MKKIILLIISFLILENEKELFAQVRVEINPKTICNNCIKLSDLILNIKYIPLETKDESLISHPTKVRLIDSLVFVKNRKPPSLKVFDYRGHFIENIGKEGKGPAEFNWLRSFCVDEKNKNIIIYNKFPDKLLIFNYNGTFQKTHSYQENIFMNDIEFFDNDKYVLMRDNRNGKTPFSYELYTNKHQFIAKKVKPLSFTMKGSFGLTEAFGYYVYNNTFMIKENLLNDTLYSISGSCDLIPRYVFSFGKYAFPVEMQINSLDLTRNGRSGELNKYIMPTGIFETYSYLILGYRLNEQFYWGFYNKQTGKAYSIQNPGITNDYDGGPDFCPIYQKNNIWVGFIDAYKLIEHINSQVFKNSIPKFPEKKKELEKLTKSMDENDNPVLMLVKLKR